MQAGVRIQKEREESCDLVNRSKYIFLVFVPEP